MKFKNYLTESYNPKTIISNGLSLFYKDLLPLGIISNNRMIDILDYVWGSDDIEFVLSSTPSNKKFIADGGFMTCGSIEISLNSKNNLSQYLHDNPDILNNFRKNSFLKEFHVILSHEYQHKKQWEESRFKQLGTCEKFTDYLSDPIEMEAYAKEASVETIEYNIKDPDAVQLYKEYFKSNHPVFKNFMKLYKGFMKNQ